jgi:hypothetical protein
MAKRLDPNVFVSDEGYTVAVLGRTGVKYTEGERSLVIDSELLAGPSGILLYASTISAWAAPYHEEHIDPDTRSQILLNIRRAFEIQGFDILVV